MWFPASSGKKSPGYNTLPEWEGVANGFEGSIGDQEPLGFWDPAGFAKDGDVEKFKRRREVEIKHGRVSPCRAVMRAEASKSCKGREVLWGRLRRSAVAPAVAIW